MDPVWCEIDLNSIAHNCKQVSQLVQPQTQIMAIVKANAYGHGAIPVATTLLAAGAHYLGVANQKEALELRQAGITAPILILGYTPREDVGINVVNTISQTVFSLEQGINISRQARDLGLSALIHLKIDTGMGRLGFLPNQEGLAAVVQLASQPNLVIQGIFTHLANADSDDKHSSREQLGIFHRFLKEIGEKGIRPPWIHGANSAAVIDLPQSHFNMVRPGIMLYGLYPSQEVKQTKVHLRPALSLKTKIIHIKTVESGVPISYGGTFVTTSQTKVATLPLGYADGLIRLLSNQGYVLVKGQQAPIIGRICMDHTMIDITHIPEAGLEDEVVLIGRQGNEIITPDQWAIRAGTINYEILTSISSRVPRKYIPKNTKE